MAKVKRKPEPTRIPPIPEDMTLEQAWNKLHEERRMWRELVARKEKEKEDEIQAKVYSVRHVADIVIARFVRSFGTKQGDEIRLDIQAPQNREGYAWVTRTEIVDDDTWRIWTKEVEIPKIE